MPKKQTTTLHVMEAKVESLENEIAKVRSTLITIENAVRDMPETLFAMLEKMLGKSTSNNDESNMLQEGFAKLKGDPLTEFRQFMRKVELPSFNGEDPAGWISRAEVYFRVQDTSPEVKVNLAQICMEGPTIHFFNSIIDENGTLTWDELKSALLERYDGNGEGNVGSGHTRGSDWVFVKRAQEQGNISRDKGSGPAKTGQSGGRRNGPRDRGFSHLTYAEILDRKQKGLCFKCVGPFHPMHKCPDKHLRVLIIEDIEEDFEENKIMAVEVCDKDGDSDGEISIMCLNNLIPATKEKFQTIHFQGKIQGVPVVILVDSGATHNFID
ncbi:hypothetical protein KIW84_024339 [Lathyrus oleraceus]|uniref:Retrotransposon gag domain-containing protein n=1 Tax=Pisum sativum TaxID=3888 RepID=A0A9D5B985_PEA|nr:hypothetical protein KIW84_024339 [Pisum sativum]